MSFLDRLFGYNELSNYGIALDVGTEFVKTLVFKVENGKAFILGRSRIHQDLKDMQGGSITDIAGVITNCSKSIEEACNMAKFTPEKVIMGIAGELVKGNTTEIVYSRKNPEKKIDSKELKEIMKKVQEKAFGQIQNQIAWETGKDDVDIRMVNAAIVDVRIDRHSVSNPIGFTGSNIKVGVYNAFAPMVYLRALETVAENLGLDLIGIAAEPYAVAKCMGGGEGQDFSAIFIDMGGGTTDVAVVRGGGLEGTKTFAIGGRAFTKRIARELNISFAQAEEVKISYSEGDLEEKKKEKVAKILDEDIKIWVSGIKMVLKEFGDAELLPGRILLCGGGTLLPEVKKSLDNMDWWEELAFSKKPKTEHIKPKDVENVKDNTGKLKDPSEITAMALANLAIDIMGGSNEMGEMLKKVGNK
ncbi:MAG: cell division FtsA domain-containing protein [Patescibacteria group bacterium]|nr:cell division FtsA domain-containing protein [Patescibacteria group bacterium]